MSLVGLNINVSLAFLKDKMEIVLEKKNDSALKHRKMMKTTICNFETKLGGRKGKERKRRKHTSRLL